MYPLKGTHQVFETSSATYDGMKRSFRNAGRVWSTSLYVVQGRGKSTAAKANASLPRVADTEALGKALAAALQRPAGEDQVSASTAAHASPQDQLPLTYDIDQIRAYWRSRGGEVRTRWGEFISHILPLVLRASGEVAAGRLQSDVKVQRQLAADAVSALEYLGPAFVKAGQSMSIRPDVVGQAVAEELARLQDAVKPFPMEEAEKILRTALAERGTTIEETFDDLNLERPVASASLAQVYRARLRSTGEEVAVKVQRPNLRPMVSRDLVIMGRAAQVVETFVRSISADRTDFQAVLQAWGRGFYSELDFQEEAKSQQFFRDQLMPRATGLYVPKVYHDLTTQQLLVSEWINGVKLTDADPRHIRSLVALGQDAFLTQLLDLGTFHADPHPGNFLALEADDPRGQVALIDFGLVAVIAPEDRPRIMASIVHLRNKDWTRLVGDLVDLRFLPEDVDIALSARILARVLEPYVFEGGGVRSIKWGDLLRELGRAILEVRT